MILIFLFKSITEGDFEFLSTLVDLFINNTPKEIESLEWEVRVWNFEGIMVRPRL
ncbi:MAG: hypothetical protein IPH28_25130 [Cytophagaceae bacterium]|nr:hypothetical protein [Cytophagaceae bacterium]